MVRDRTNFGVKWYRAEGEGFHTMNNTWRDTVQKTAWPSCIIVRTWMASDMDYNH